VLKLVVVPDAYGDFTRGGWIAAHGSGRGAGARRVEPADRGVLNETEAARMLPRCTALARFSVRTALYAMLAFGSAHAQPAGGSPPAYPISGTVVDRQGGLPIPGAQLTLVQGLTAIASTASDRSGKFAFPAVPQGVYNIQVTARGYQTARSEDIYLAGGPATVSLALSRAQSATAAGLKTIATVSTRAGVLQTTTTIQQQVNPDVIQRTGQLRAAEQIGKLPGVNLIGQDSAIGDDIALDIRGLKPSETQVLLDGHPIGPLGVYPASIGGGQGGYDYQVSPTFALENTVLTYGSGATGLYGVDAVGGAVDFQTISPSAVPGAALKIGIGEFGRQLFAAQTNGTIGKFGYVLLHGVQGAYGNFPGQYIAQTGARGNDFTTATLRDVTYWVSGNYLLHNDLGKLQYSFSPSTKLTLTGYDATSYDDKTGEGDNDFITYDYALYQAQHNSNCTTASGTPGVTVMTDSGSQCYTPKQYAANASGPAGGGPGAFQALANQDYHARLETTAGRHQIVLDSYVDNYTQNRERPASFLNGPLAILSETYRSIGTLVSDDVSLSKNDVGFGYFTTRQYTNGHNVNGSTILPHTPLLDKLDSFFARDVYQPNARLSFFANAWFKHSSIGGNSFDPRLTLMYRLTPRDVVRVTGGKSSADPAPIALVITGAGGINPGNCHLFSIGTIQSPGELPEKATDFEVSYGHRFFSDTALQAVVYDTNETNTIFEGQQPAANFPAVLASLGPAYLQGVFSRIETICPNFAPPNPPPTLANLVANTNLNLAKTRARGIELSGRMRITPHFFVDAYWDTQSSAIFDAPVFLLQDNPTLINGAQLPVIPLHKFGAVVDYSTPGGTEIYIDYTHFDGNNPLHRPPFGWADAAITQAVNKDLSLTFGLTNVFNSAVDTYGRIGLGVFVPENQFGTDPNALAQGSERFGLAPRALTVSLTERVP
jgi:outer membrane receptor protein involved in Fe transport